MSSKKLSPEEELEKQYRDYKAQFEQWKEKNRESIGSDAYIRYVKQFEEWEKDVEKRRAAVRQKAEQERKAAELEAAKREAERLKQNEVAAAKAYAEEQAHYLSMHQRAMQEEQNSRTRQPTHYQSPHDLNTMNQSAVGHTSSAQPLRNQLVAGQQVSQQRAELPATEMSSMATVMQQMLQFVMGNEKQQNGEADANGSAQNSTLASIVPAGQPAQPESTAPPQLWGSDGAVYTSTDPMFRRWDVRAAPPNFRVSYQPPPQSIPITPYWLSTKKMQESKVVLAPQFNVPPPMALFPSAASTLNSSFNIPPPNLNMPPPSLFKVV